MLSANGTARAPENCGTVYEWKHYTAHDPFQTWEMDHSGSPSQPTHGVYDISYASSTPNQRDWHLSLRHEYGYDHIANGEQVHLACTT